ncbi:hypothetical protein GUJ93_ZPchr0011g28140 [Zizania palustris]|uniref:Uncharacterized protein n=1 Tax=Zizania palustris TaxID=103762 RepID=A0A8J5WI45_ZIZPA|nr:hypothetical protein GUJ93_ZPchr0011g28140 [Zizania palustris]
MPLRRKWVVAKKKPPESSAIVHDIAEDGVPKEEKSRGEKEALDHMCGLLGGCPRVQHRIEARTELTPMAKKGTGPSFSQPSIVAVAGLVVRYIKPIHEGDVHGGLLEHAAFLHHTVDVVVAGYAEVGGERR